MLDALFTLLIDVGRLMELYLSSRRGPRHPHEDVVNVADLLMFTSTSAGALGDLVKITRTEWEDYATERWATEERISGSAVRQLTGLEALDRGGCVDRAPLFDV